MANIYEVARLARVSIATVSRVERGGQGVAPATRQRVLDAIDELRYRPSGLARSLAGGRRGALGIVFPDLSGPYYAGIILGFEECAASAGQSVMILATHGRNSDEEVRSLAQRVDGLVVMGRTISDETVARLDADGVPVVLLARPPVGGIPAIRSENVQCALDLTRHVIGHGVKRIVFLGDPDCSPDVAERWIGFERGHREAGLGDPDHPVRCAMREEDGYDAALELLRGERSTSRDERPDALLCANDETALGALAAAQAAGLAVPRDLVVTGWDDIPVARFASPPLTTVRQPLRELGARAATVLQNGIPGTDGPGHEHQSVLAAELVIRASCGCAEDRSPGGDIR